VNRAPLTVTHNTVRQLFLAAADIKLDSTFEALRSNVTIQPSNSTGSMLSLGHNSGGLHLSNAEVGRIRTRTILNLGSLQTDYVVMDGLSVGARPTDVHVRTSAS